MEKTRHIAIGLLLVSAVCLAQSSRTAGELTTLLQEAQYQEQTAGNLDKAIDLYSQVLTEAAQVERLAARAAFQLAVCYQKKGDTPKAAEYYRKVITDFPSQKALADRAKEQLDKLMTTEVSKIVGHWQSVDFVASPDQFQPGKKQWKGDLFLKEATFNADGSSSLPSRWTEGWIHDADSNAKAEYYIKSIDGQTYLFLPWLSGDVTVRGQKPSYYVLKSESPQQPDPNLTQEMYNDIQPNGSIKFRHPQRIANTGTEPIIEKRFINSDFVQLTAMKDEQGKPIDFTATHDSQRQIYRYHVIFDKPIQPGESMVYISEGTISGLVIPIKNQQDTYRYFMTHSPATGKPTLRIEHYLLPHGAQLLTTFPEDIQRGEKDGRIELRVEKIIPANGSLTTSFTYKLTQ